ncbi:MAG: mismatch repair protein MutS [Sphingomonadales bacterium]|nr:mismatch repair protein MutS [Sphingomonadales bacterium]
MTGRRLSPEERAIWGRVAITVRRSKGIAADPDVAPASVEPARKEKAPAKAKPVVAPIIRKAVPAKAKPGITLDGSWDRRIASGGAGPERTIDLHGCTVDQAHRRLLDELDRALADEVRVLLIVTGKAPRSDASRIDLPLRGIIRASIHDWVAASRHAGRIAAIRAAHPRHGGAGALYIILRRAKNGAAASPY